MTNQNLNHRLNFEFVKNIGQIFAKFKPAKKKMGLILFQFLFLNAAVEARLSSAEKQLHQDLLLCLDSLYSPTFKCEQAESYVTKCSQEFTDYAFQFKIVVNSSESKNEIKWYKRLHSIPIDEFGREFQGQLFLHAQCESEKLPSKLRSGTPVVNRPGFSDPLTNVNRNDEIIASDRKVRCLDAVEPISTTANSADNKILIDKLTAKCNSGDLSSTIEAKAIAKLITENDYLFEDSELTADRLIDENVACVDIYSKFNEEGKPKRTKIGCNSIFNSNVIDQKCVSVALKNAFGDSDTQQKQSLASSNQKFREQIANDCFAGHTEHGGDY